jgi:hypothetical protein
VSTRTLHTPSRVCELLACYNLQGWPHFNRQILELKNSLNSEFVFFSNKFPAFPGLYGQNKLKSSENSELFPQHKPSLGALRVLQTLY